jgi:hypothetical protein
LHVEIQRRTGTGKAMQQVSHRNVEGGGEDSAVQRTLRIEQEVVYSECYLANVLEVGDIEPEQSGEEEVTEYLPLTACRALERRAGRGDVDRPATGRTSRRHITVFDRTFQTFGFVHSFLQKQRRVRSAAAPKFRMLFAGAQARVTWSAALMMACIIFGLWSSNYWAPTMAQSVV